MVQLQLRLHSHPLRPYLHQAPPAEIPSTRTTVLDLKTAIAAQWPDKPHVEGLLLVLGGKVLADKEEVWELLRQREVEAPDTAPHIIHVIVRPESWTTTTRIDAEIIPPLLVTPTPNPPPVASTSTAPPPAPTSTPTPTVPTPLAPNPVVYEKYISHLAQLLPLQRAILLLNLQKSHYVYTQLVQLRMTLLGWSEDNQLSIRSDTISRSDVNDKDPYDIKEGETEEQWRARMGVEEIGQVVELLKACDLWELVEERVVTAKANVENWDERNPAGKAGAVKGEFELVQVGGLPYLLQTPAKFIQPTPAPPVEIYVAMKRAFAITQILLTLLQLLVTYSPTAPAQAYGRATVRHTILADPDLVLPPALVAGIVPRRAGLPVRRRPLSIVINLESVIAMVIPLFLLSLKLGFLLWIFGRHASTNKRIAMGVMALLYIIWEGWTLARTPRPRRVRVAGVRAAAAPVVDPPIPVANIDRVDPALPEGLRQRNAQALAAADAQNPVNPVPVVPVVAPPARTPRPPTSRLTPKYWINYIAAIGLAAEARELGLIPRSIAGRPVVNPPQPIRNPNDRIGLAREARARAMRTAMVGVVLFFGTLLPEVEKKRRRALEKRERLLESRRVNRARRAAVAAAAALGAVEGNAGNAGSGASTPGVIGIVTPVVEQVPEIAVTPATAATDTSSSTIAPIPSTSTAATQDPTPAGRAVISDAALFADEPNRMPPPATHPIVPAAVPTPVPVPALAPEIEAEENDEVDLMTDEAEGEGDEDGEVDEVAAMF